MADIDNSLHVKVRQGFTDGSKYHEGRPGYTDEAVQQVIKMAADQTICQDYEWEYIELGAGTGKFTNAITKRLSNGTKYLASEPMPDFLASLQQNCPTVETKQFAANSIPLHDKSVKNVLAAQCFHWFATPEALQEIHRILIPGGNLVMLWNVMENKPEWIEKLRATYEKELEGVPQHSKMAQWIQVFDDYKLFELKSEEFAPGPIIKGPVENIIKHFASLSVIAEAPKHRQKEIFDNMRKIMATHSDVNGSDSLSIPMHCHILHYKKIRHM